MTFKNKDIDDHMRVCLAYLDEQLEPVSFTRLLYVCNNAKGGFPTSIKRLLESGMIKKVQPSNGSMKQRCYCITPKGHRALDLMNRLSEMVVVKK